MTDGNGVVEQCNPAADRLLTDVQRPVGQRCADVLDLRHGERRLDCSTGCALLAICGDGDLGEEVWRLEGLGERRPLLANVAAVTDADGNVVEVVHSLRDVTRLKQAEEAKALFLATASHELKTPISVIAGFSRMLLKETTANPEHRLALEAIDQRAGEQPPDRRGRRRPGRSFGGRRQPRHGDRSPSGQRGEVLA